MRHFFIIASTVVLTVIALLLPSAMVTGANRDVQGEQETVVHYGTTACGVERWWIKTGIDPGAQSINIRKVTSTNIIHLRSLPAPNFLPSSSRIRPVEKTVWTVSAILLRYKLEADSDVHLVIADAGGRTMIAEIPAPACVGLSSPFRSRIRATRYAFGGRFHPGDSWQRPNVRVQITGVGYFDFKHGQSGVAPNAIELHPVLSIKVGSAARVTAPPPQPPTSSGGLHVTAWVSPSTMPYNAYPTLHAKTTPGATCSASVVYSTGRSPVSFSGSPEHVGSSGVVGWSWHEETSGSGGTGTVTCTYHGRSGKATAHFTVTG
jgi:hypothetical protein